MDHLDEDPSAASAAFGQRLRELRAEHGLSQDALASNTDVHPTAIGRFERGAREPRLTTILRLARGLDVTPGELVDELSTNSPTAEDSEAMRIGERPQVG
jgi:transcriptional regulator with XRE-family HTH domain